MGTKADHGEVRTKYQAPSPLRPILFIHFISSSQINKPHEQTAEVLPDAGIHCICSTNQLLSPGQHHPTLLMARLYPNQAYGEWKTANSLNAPTIRSSLASRKFGEKSCGATTSHRVWATLFAKRNYRSR